MNTAKQAIKAFEEGYDYNDLIAQFEAKSFGSIGICRYAAFADGSAIKSISSYSVEECDVLEAQRAIDQQ